MDVNLMDANLITQIIVAIGTTTLAVATFATIYQSKLQLRELKKQIYMSRSRQMPILKCSNLKFVGNKPHFNITNVGEGLAVDIGVSVNFYPTVNDHPSIGARFTLEGREVFPTEFISFPSEKGEMMLVFKESGIFESDILFGMFTKEIMEGLSGKGFTFDKLREFCKRHDVSTIAVDMGVIGKNVMEEPTFTTRIAKFFIDFEKHNTLEEAYNESLKSKRSPYSLPLSSGEIKFMRGDMYRNSRSSRANF